MARKRRARQFLPDCLEIKHQLGGLIFAAHGHSAANQRFVVRDRDAGRVGVTTPNPLALPNLTGLAPQPATPSAQDRQLAFLNATPDKRTVSADRVTAPASSSILQAGAVIRTRFR